MWLKEGSSWNHSGWSSVRALGKYDKVLHAGYVILGKSTSKSLNFFTFHWG